jgi:hypothetical protein
MTFTILDRCRNCNHSVHTHIGPYGRDGEAFGYFKVLKWDMCNVYGNMGEKMCGCTKFMPKDNLKYLEMLSEQAAH